MGTQNVRPAAVKARRIAADSRRYPRVWDLKGVCWSRMAAPGCWQDARSASAELLLEPMMRDRLVVGPGYGRPLLTGVCPQAGNVPAAPSEATVTRFLTCSEACPE